jgi:amino acid permease
MEKIYDYKGLLFSVATFGVALSGSIVFFLLTKSLVVGIMVFTGVIVARNIIDTAQSDFTHNFPVIEGIFDGICMGIFIILLIAAFK